MLVLILLVFAFVAFFLAALNIAEPWRSRLIAAGLAACALAELLGRTGAVLR